MANDTVDGVIRVLDDAVIDRIAAGEVIERPASVVKELVENAFDAGASQVEVQLEGGGLARITVSDDGKGMSRADLERCILRHATSKLASAEDLFRILTYGFRGEALSSIAAVARLTITTRRAEDDVAVRLRVRGGAVEGVDEVGAPVGTTLDVEELFYNTPARLKFLKSQATEQANATEAALRVILGTRRGGALVAAGERRLIDVPPGATGEARVKAALGPRVDELFAFDSTTANVRVSGFITRPEVDRGDAKGLWFFVNGRFVRDRMLQRALLDGYRGMVETGRYPMAVVYIDLDPTAIDVNVHPQKLEVRFSDGGAVYRAVSTAVAQKLAEAPWLFGQQTLHTVYPTATPRYGYVRDASSESGYGAPAARPFESAGPPLTTYLPLVVPQAPKPQAQALLDDVPGFSPRGYFSRLRPVGQVLGTYLVCEGEDGLVLLDQHAAHERVAFERLRAQAAQGRIEKQELLFPDIVELSARHALVVEERGADLARYGFDIEPVGPGRYAVRAIPTALRGAQVTRLVHDLLDELLGGVEGNAGAEGEAARQAEASLLSRCACHTAVRAGDALSSTEIAALLLALDEVDFGANCPHGRPVYHVFSRGALEKMFHR